MIISELTGGLGNQMFQYAFGYSLARQNETDFFFWYKQLDGNTQRELEIIYFNISALEADEKDLECLGYPRSLKNHVLEKLGFISPLLLKEKSYAFDNDALLATKKILVQGYWQSEKYFSIYKKQIQKEFSFKEKLTGINKNIAEKLQGEQSVSVHIRRGDYASNSISNAYHGLCSNKYYEEGMLYIDKTIKNPVFYFFSDDPEWVRKNLKTKTESYYINWNTAKNSFRDMQLMSSCKHNIIANSSFSWWGAWLNANPKKIVIAPKKWFNDTSIDTSDLIPDNWLKI